MSLSPEPTQPPEVDETVVLQVLQLGELEVAGRIVGASNATLLVHATLDGVTVPGVYKPVAGEKPLWDFPRHTLARRERAAYVLSAATGWRVVPPTVLRDGPFGEGSIMWWLGDGEPGAGVIDVCAPSALPEGWLRVVDAEDGYGEPLVLGHADDGTLRRMAVFDVVANNTDRKGGHVLRSVTGDVHGIDHGLTFNEEDKLRTVLWGWAGKKLPADVLDDVLRVAADLGPGGSLREQLGPLLSRAELDQTWARAEALAGSRRHPRPAGGWPSIPWPAF